ncbi:MAG: hypothetical protein HOK71_12650 [Planctomycetaceae bacterium]|jgi:hypothetical protein|nr:hypothetical protein [Planctomycetaceae bacterium]MBT6485494.1 hypothetical protein [Planctomycetaceae bacterium]
MIQDASFEHTQARRGVRGPAWRFELAESLQPQSPFSRQARRLLQQYDVHVQHAHTYFNLGRRGADGCRQAREKFPTIAAAEKLNQDRALCAQTKVLVLGDCPLPEVAERLQIDEQVVEVWEKLFFDIREAREAIGWIFAHIIRAEQNSGNGSLAARFKLAHLGGPAGARALLDAESRVPLTAAEQLFDRSLKLHLRFDEAVTAPFCSGRDKFRFLNNSLKLKLAEQCLEVEKQKLAARCDDALRKHELAKLRLVAAADRRRGQVEERARKAQQRNQQQQEIAAAREEQRRLRGEALLAEQQAARARAAASPLAQLTWSSATPTQTDTPLADRETQERQWVDERDFVSGSDGNMFDEEEKYDAPIELEVAIA